MKTFLLLLPLGLASCATVFNDADYKYNATDPTTGKTVNIRIVSGRDLPQGGKVKIGPDGTMEVEVGSLRADQSGLTEAFLNNLMQMWLQKPKGVEVGVGGTLTPNTGVIPDATDQPE